MGRATTLVVAALVGLGVALVPPAAATAGPLPARAEAAAGETVAAEVMAEVMAEVAVGDLGPGQAVGVATSALVMQGDGNLVLYRDGAARWHTSTWGHPGARFAAQGDGNLVVYDVGGRPLWDSRTGGLGGTDLRLAADGLRLRVPGGRVVWQDGAYLGGTLAAGDVLRTGEGLVPPGHGYRLVLQGDGNLVLYRSGGGAVWHSRTYGTGADTLRTQTDGNLVLSAGGVPVWHTSTGPVAGAALVVQDDGNAVLYGGGRALWDSGGRTGRSAVRVLPAFASSVATVSEQQLGASYRAGCPVGPAALRLVRVSYVDLDGAPRTGELVVHSDLAARTVEVFRRLYEQRFPLQQVVPVSVYGGSDDASMAAGNTSAFNCRRTTGGTAWSEHSYGRALDVNPVQNPYVTGGTVLPEAGRAYLDRSVLRPGMVEAGAVAAFTSQGFVWGGTWSSAKDYQHFSTTGR